MVEHQTENLGVRGSNPFIGMINKYTYFYLIKQKTTKIIKTKQINYTIINNNVTSKDYLFFLKKLFNNSVLIKKNHNLEYFLYSINHFENKPINIICKNWLLLLYFSNISKFYTKFNTNWHFIDVNDILNYEVFNKTWKIFYKKRFILILSTKRATFYNWFIQLTQFKNSKILIRLIQNYFVKLHLKKHRRGFYNVRSLFNMWFSIYSKENMIKGLVFF